MKDTVDETGIDIDCVSVDSAEVRERIMEDTKYGVREVPSVLVFFSNGRHKLYVRKAMETWFSQLVANIKAQQAQDELERQAQAAAAAKYAAEMAIPVIAERGLSEKYPNYQRRMAQPGQRAAPPQRRHQGGDVEETLVDFGGDSGESTSIDDFGGGGQRAGDQSGMSVGSVPHSVKKDGPTPAELAKKMMSMRESLEEEESVNKPFL